MRKMYKINSPLANKQQVNDGLVDEFVGLRIDYQQTMHASLANTDVADAMTGLQQDLTRIAKFKTNIEVKDLVEAFYFKLDILTDLLEARRICRAAKTEQIQKFDSSRKLTRFVQGSNPLFNKWTYSNVTADLANIMNKWNEIYDKVNRLMPLPRFEEFYRRAFYADGIFKDYDKFDRSPLICFSRKYTVNITADANNVAMVQSQATTANSSMPMEVLDVIDRKITDYLNDDGNYIFGVLRKISTAGGFKPDCGYWKAWSKDDTLPISDASELEEIIQNIWEGTEKPDTFTKEQITSTFYGETGRCSIYIDTASLNYRTNIHAGKFVKPLSGAKLCDALQFVVARSTDPEHAAEYRYIGGMYITNYAFFAYDYNGYNFYHLTTIDNESMQHDIQYVFQKYMHIVPNLEMKFEIDATPDDSDDEILADVAYIVNRQGQWRFETDETTLGAILRAFNMSMLTPTIEVEDTQK